MGAPDLEAVARDMLRSGSPCTLAVAHAERLVALGEDPCGRPVVVEVARDLAGHRREATVLARLAAAGCPVPAVFAVHQVDQPTAGVGPWAEAAALSSGATPGWR